jgi:uncharacterized metal-binding protein YceD (DUF177 family)
MADPFPAQLQYRVRHLGARKTTHFDVRPSAAEAAALAGTLGITALKAPRFSGELRPSGKHDFELEAVLETTFVQPCVLTLAPVFTTIRETVRRTYVYGLTPPDGEEVEMPADDSIEPLPAVIDIGEVMLEALLITLPEYPKAPDAELGEILHAEPGVAPLRDSDLRPFAGLASLADRLRSDEPEIDTSDGKAIGAPTDKPENQI